MASPGRPPLLPADRMSKKVIFKAKPSQELRWKAAAERNGMAFSEWVRYHLERAAGRDPIVKLLPEAMGRLAPENTISPPARTDEALVGAGRVRAMDSLSVEAERERARLLAQKQGRCTADVAAGTRCKLCGRVH